MKKENMLVFTGMGFELLGLILTSLFLGQHIDKKFSWSGLATVCLSLVALISWFIHLIVLLKRLQNSSLPPSESN